MHLHEITAESLTRELGVEIPAIYVVVAKHSVMGMDTDGITKILGCTVEDILEVEAKDSYKAVRIQISQAYAELTVNQTSGWDALENMALNSLIKRAPMERDIETLLKIAAVANKAQRMHAKDSNVLDPAKVSGRTVITLSQRLVQRLNGRGDTVTEETRQLSIADGSMSNPNFSEVDELLSVRNQPVFPRNVEISTRNADPTSDELLEMMSGNK